MHAVTQYFVTRASADDISPLHLRGMPSHPENPWYDCPSCANNSWKKMSGDATVTLDKVAKGGKASEDLAPQISRCFTDSHKEMAKFAASRQAAAGGGADQPMDEAAAARPRALEEEEEYNECTTSYHAGRVEATHSGVKRQRGVIGLCCPHSYPLRGAWGSMPLDENYTFYDIVLEAVITKIGNCAMVLTGFDMYLDFGCQYGPHFHKRRQASPTLQEIADRLRFIVPWMHSVGHIEVMP